MVQGLAEAAPDEIRAERLEHVLERPGTRPLAHGVAHVHPARQHVRHQDVIGVGAVIHQVDDDVAFGDARERRLVLIVDGDLEQQVDEDLGGVVAELVIRKDVEIGDDLVDVAAGAPAHHRFGRVVGGGVVGDRRNDDWIFE